MNEFESCLQKVRVALQGLSEASLEEKPLPFGRQFKLARGKDKAALSVYSGKKGISLVWGGQAGDLLAEAQRAVGVTGAVSVKKKGEQPLLMPTLLEDCAGFKGLWAGSDESGKGDFFGPLVVAAVLLDLDTAKALQEEGVRDCKSLTDKEVKRQAPLIRKLAPLHAVLALKPEFYNLRYGQLKQKNKNLNHLLANGHVTALRDVLQKRPDCNYALIDRFAVASGIREALEKEFPSVIVVEQKQAERDTAVAAASVLARARFVEIMEELSAAAGCILPKGGGSEATATAQRILTEQGDDVLNKLVKKHFANYKRLK